MKSGINQRLKQLPPYLFIEIDKTKTRLQAAGVDVVDFGIGDPDLPTPGFIVSAMQEAVAEASFHRYPLGRGKPFFREAVARWFTGRYGVSLDPDREVLALIGSKEGIGHLPLAFLDPGQLALVPEPGYPVYANATILAGGLPWFMPLREENGFLPDLEAIPADVLGRARILFLNYPNNPTGALAPDDFWPRAIALAAKHDLILASDAAYAEVYFGERPPRSVLEFPGAREVAVEFHSFSKTWNMTGWRLAFACGSAAVIDGLAAVKGNLDSGVFEAVQAAGVAALSGHDDFVASMRDRYRRRMDLLVGGLRASGFDCRAPGGTFYLWLRVPAGQSAAAFAADLLEKYGILVTPGNGFGPSGEGYARFSVTLPGERITEAVRRLERGGLENGKER